jgi:trk system potassium uptake protein
MNVRKFIPDKLISIYRWAKRILNDPAIAQSKFTLLSWLSIIYQVSNIIIPIGTLLLFGLIIYDFGFFSFYSHNETVYLFLKYILILFKVLFIARFISEWVEIKQIKAHLYSFGLVLLIFYLSHIGNVITSLEATHSSDLLLRKGILYAGITFLFLTEASNLLKFVYNRRQNPAFVFISGFAIIILSGTFLLMLPTATTHGITFVNAFFTSTSAVCVTGLTVVDTGTDFTTIGQVIILILIQVGGLGIMTFTGLLGYLAAGSVSFHNQMALKSMVSSTKISNVITIVTRILIVTLFFEAIGAVILYFRLDKELFDNSIERTFFAIFHSISAFCNAGFSTESAGLYTEAFRFNYTLQFMIAILIILGGMGFPIVFNIFTFVRLKVFTLYSRITQSTLPEKKTRVIQVNSKLALTTTLILLVAGFIFYVAFEYNASLKEHPSTIGKIVTAFFGSVTPRTAGFNTIDMTQLTLPMIMIYLFLMWVGASPSSTGGGIKTTTIAVAFLNLRTMMHGRNRTEVYYTQISEPSINRAFAVILLSLFIIGATVLLISINDADKGILKISFEAFSAFSTVGLTLGITSELSDISKLILVLTMFIGRVGALTMLIAFVSQQKDRAYQYPVEEIMY